MPYLSEYYRSARISKVEYKNNQYARRIMGIEKTVWCWTKTVRMVPHIE